MLTITKNLSSKFCCSSGPQIKNERKWKDKQICAPKQRIKKAVEHQGDGDANCS